MHVDWQMASDIVDVEETTRETTESWLARLSNLSELDRERLVRIAGDMPFVADISRSDLLLYVRRSENEAVLVTHARPHSIMSVHPASMLGHRVGAAEEPTVFRAMRWRSRVTGSRRLIDGGAPVIQKVWVIRGDGGRVIAALNVEANLIAYVRQRSRSKVFQKAVELLQQMLILGELGGAGELSPFREHDGILVVDDKHVIRYASGIATEHYRKLGYMDGLHGRHLSTLDTGDQRMFADVLRDQGCHEQEFIEYPYGRNENRRIWIRKAVPLIAYRWGKSVFRPWEWLKRRPVGVLFAVHDATEERLKERELKIKSAMIQEVHHRVKNNLQTVAAMLRMQIRRSNNEEVKLVLRDSISRIFSMAVVHEYLSRAEGHAINMREVAQRIIQQTKQGILSPDKQIHMLIESGNNLYLPARQATACALVINELVQNSVEHGYGARSVGTITIRLEDEGDHVRISIADDGEGLPPDFEMGRTDSLGLQIVQTLVQDDLRGVFEIKSADGVQAVVRFSKKILEGEEHWNV
jgi:two-component sensor histidine kinase